MPDPLRTNARIYRRQKGARTRASIAPRLGRQDPRWDRQRRLSRTSDEYAEPIALNAQGRQTILIDANSFLGLTPKGELTARLADGLQAVPGSPVQLGLKLGTGVVLKDGTVTVNAEAVPAFRALRSTVQTQAATIASLQAVQATLESDLADAEAELLSLDSRVTDLETP